MANHESNIHANYGLDGIKALREKYQAIQVENFEQMFIISRYLFFGYFSYVLYFTFSSSLRVEFGDATIGLFLHSNADLSVHCLGFPIYIITFNFE